MNRFRAAYTAFRHPEIIQGALALYAEAERLARASQFAIFGGEVCEDNSVGVKVMRLDTKQQKFIRERVLKQIAK